MTKERGSLSYIIRRGQRYIQRLRSMATGKVVLELEHTVWEDREPTRVWMSGVEAVRVYEEPPVRPLPVKVRLVELLVKTKLVASASEARRLIAQGGIKYNGIVVRDHTTICGPGCAQLQRGKRRWCRVWM